MNNAFPQEEREKQNRGFVKIIQDYYNEHPPSAVTMYKVAIVNHFLGLRYEQESIAQVSAAKGESDERPSV